VVTVLCSGKAAPGVTTATWALALAWPGEVLAVDADPDGGDMAAGLLSGRVGTERGVVSWAAAVRRLPAVDAVRMLAEHAVTIPEAPLVWFLAGVQGPEQSAGLRAGGWERLAAAVGHGLDRDVLVDAGRLSDRSCWPVLRAADRVLLVVRPSLRSVHAAQVAAGLLRSNLGDLGRVALLIVGGGAYTSKEVSDALHLAPVGELPADIEAAAVLSDGAAVGVRGLMRSRLLRSARTVADGLATPSAVRAEAVGS
jgi:MinD-like ATPase involved in chromosome partitioning or flagellar assembly